MFDFVNVYDIYTPCVNGDEALEVQPEVGSQVPIPMGSG